MNASHTVGMGAYDGQEAVYPRYSLLDIAIRNMLFASFLLTLLQYYIPIGLLSVAPPLLLYIAAACALLGPKRREHIPLILSGGGVLILTALLSELVSYYTGDSYSVQYGLIFIGLMFACRMIILHVGFAVVLRCYVVSGLVSTLVVAIEGQKEIARYRPGLLRFAGGANVHPNLLGFTFAGYLPAFIGLALTLPPGKKRVAVFIATIVASYIVYITGSRGSVGGVLVAGLILCFRYFVSVKGLLSTRFGYMFWLLVGVVFTSSLYILSHPNTVIAIGQSLDDAFALTSSGRGIHSGFSGRTVIWQSTLHRLTGLHWLFGMGFRQAFLVDNGYISLLFDSGLVGGIAVVVVMVRAVVWLWRDASVSHSRALSTYRLTLLCMLLVYMLNNFSTRYLYSFGNQFSMLVIFMILCRKKELLL